MTAMGPSYSRATLNDLTEVVFKDEDAIGGGSYSDVFPGTWVIGETSKKVAIKLLRPHVYSPEDLAKLDKRLREEMLMWSNLKHPNIVLLHGAAFGFGKCPAMVFQWMDQGTLSEYVEQKKDNLSFQARLNICLGIARGLSYLHSHKVVHGDLSPGSVLMDNDIPHLNNYGLSNVLAELQTPFFFSSQGGLGARWIAPELLQATDRDGVESSPELTMPSDVYSFASVALYVISGTLPYGHIRHNNAVIMQIMKSIQAGSNVSPPRPTQSSLLTDDCWQILTKCWALVPAERPNIGEVERLLQKLLV